jgi:hypothetical protein
MVTPSLAKVTVQRPKTKSAISNQQSEISHDVVQGAYEIVSSDPLALPVFSLKNGFVFALALRA